MPALALAVQGCGEKKNTSKPPVAPSSKPAPAPKATVPSGSPAPMASPSPAPSPSPEPVAQTPALPALPKKPFDEPAASFAALAARKKKCDDKKDRPAFFASPQNPSVHDPLKLFVVSEKKLEDVTLLARDPTARRSSSTCIATGGRRTRSMPRCPSRSAASTASR